MSQIVELSVTWKSDLIPAGCDPTEEYLCPGYETEHGALQFLIWGTSMYRVIPLCNIIQATSRWIDAPERKT